MSECGCGTCLDCILAKEAPVVEAPAVRLEGTPTVVTTDGSVYPNPGEGGWAAIAQIPGFGELIWSGYEPEATNNTMELQAIVEALERLPPKQTLVIRSDSQWVIKCAVGEWGRHRPEHRPLWDRYDRAVARHHTFLFEWVKGHAGDPLNERADKLAGEARRSGSA